jgi:chromosome segregation ATPase
METKFREFSELMDDVNDKMPEGTYLAIYDKLKELRDESKKNTEVESDDDDYYERGGLWFANDQWRLWQVRYQELNKETVDLRRSNNVLHNTGKNLEKELAESEQQRDEYEHKNKELEDKIKERDDKIRELEEAAKMPVVTKKVAQCKCGSTTHLRTNHKSCRLNRANVTVRANVV